MDSYYLQQINNKLADILSLLEDSFEFIEMNSRYILLSIIFFGLLFFCFRFINMKRTDFT